MHLRSAFLTFITVALRAIYIGYWLFASIFCLLAFLPYTFYAFITAPPYRVIPLFIHYHAPLYWTAWCALFLSYFAERRLEDRRVQIVLALLLLLGEVLQHSTPYAALRPAYSSFLLALLSLAPIPVLLIASSPAPSRSADHSKAGPWLVRNGLLAAILFILIQTTGAAVSAVSTGSSIRDSAFWWANGVAAFRAMAWAIFLSAAAQAIVIVGGRRRHPRMWTSVGLLTMATASLGILTVNFLRECFSFRGLSAWPYSFALAAAVATSVVVLRPVRSSTAHILVLLTGASAALTGFLLPTFLAAADWNGVGMKLWSVTLALVCGALVFRHGAQRSYARHFALAPLSACAAVVVLALMPRVEALASYPDSRAISFAPCPWTATPTGQNFCDFLEQHTNIQDDLPREPHFDLANDLHASEGPKPNIVLLVVDSLRTDYLSPYAKDVDFTPNLQRLADESYVFRNAYTPYAGTVMAEPALWAGTELLHKQYLQPFHNVNALEKLLDAENYTKIVSVDTVLSALLPVSSNLVDIDRNQGDWGSFDFCQTWPAAVAAMDADKSGRPKFFFAQSVNVHRFALQHVAAALRVHRQYSGRNTKYASELERYDTCFGSFVVALKDKGLWDNTILILTADHGDSLGDGGRQGHSYVLAPEVIRIPLIVRLPAKLRATFTADPRALALLQDVTPSLYRILGHSSLIEDPLAGRSLFRLIGAPLPAPRDSFMIASDSKPIYGIVDDRNGKMYVVDVDKRLSSVYDLRGVGSAVAHIAPPEFQQAYNRQVYDRVQLVADRYGFRPK